ncbi:MAG: hypothetical protein R2789_12055 [Microthrixaceae bacterium]
MAVTLHNMDTYGVRQGMVNVGNEDREVPAGRFGSSSSGSRPASMWTPATRRRCSPHQVVP